MFHSRLVSLSSKMVKDWSLLSLFALGTSSLGLQDAPSIVSSADISFTHTASSANWLYSKEPSHILLVGLLVVGFKIESLRILSLPRFLSYC